MHSMLPHSFRPKESGVISCMRLCACLFFRRDKISFKNHSLPDSSLCIYCANHTHTHVCALLGECHGSLLCMRLSFSRCSPCCRRTSLLKLLLLLLHLWLFARPPTASCSARVLPHCVRIRPASPPTVHVNPHLSAYAVYESMQMCAQAPTLPCQGKGLEQLLLSRRSPAPCLPLSSCVPPRGP